MNTRVGNVFAYQSGDLGLVNKSTPYCDHQ